MMNPRKPAWEKWRGMDMEERKGRARHGVDDGRYGGAHDGKHDRGR